MTSRSLLALLPLVAAPIISGLVASSHTALASPVLVYEIQASSRTTPDNFTIYGPVGHNSGTPTSGHASCGDYSASTGAGWTLHGSASTRSYATEAASEADPRAPGSVGVTFTDSHGNMLKISGVGVFDNGGDNLLAGSFKMTYTAASGATTTCTVSSSGSGASGEAEMEND